MRQRFEVEWEGELPAGPQAVWANRAWSAWFNEVFPVSATGKEEM